MSKSEIEDAQDDCVPLEAWVDWELIIYMVCIFGFAGLSLLAFLCFRLRSRSSDSDEEVKGEREMIPMDDKITADEENVR